MSRAREKSKIPNGSDVPMFACRAWVNFDGTRDSTGASSTANTARLIRASGNVTSVVRNGAGAYTVTFTTAMPNANYAAVSSGKRTSSTTPVDDVAAHTQTTTTCLFYVTSGAGGTLVDADLISIAFFS